MMQQLGLKATLLVGALSVSVSAVCSKTDEKPSLPREASALLRQQANRSLSLPDRFHKPTATMDEAFEASTWEEFARMVGTQDFSVDFLRDGTGSEYVHFSYGLGDNEFGSVHPREGSAEPIISVDDEEWNGLGPTLPLLVTCLRKAEEADEDEKATLQQAVAALRPAVLAAACSKTDEEALPPRQVSALLRQQASRSLSLPGRFQKPTATMDEAFEAGTWDEFARMVGTQDFSLEFLRDVSGNQYVHFSYGLGDNELGSVHPREGSVQPIISVDDGEWNGLGLTPTSLVTCLRKATGWGEEDGEQAATAQSSSSVFV